MLLNASQAFTVTNNLITQNGQFGSAALYGGVRAMQVPSGSRFVNNTVSDNRSGSVVGTFAAVRCDVALALANVIVFGNLADGTASGISTTCSATYSDIDPSVSGSGNFDTNPLYDSTYHLMIGSPCINAGDPAGVPPAPPIDFDSQTRPRGARVDIGADEAG